VCDYLVKLVLAVVFLAPYRVIMAWLLPAWNAPVGQQG